ncbi:MAG: hypothetical protein H6837_17765 [Planctomycetes bacterium]|nr:hypothetical protein [Planctomycetota bacterium]
MGALLWFAGGGEPAKAQPSEQAAAAVVPAAPEPERIKVRSMTAMAVLHPKRALVLRPQGEFKPEPNSTTKLFFTTQPHYGGDLSDAAIDQLIRTGRSAALQWRLAPEHQARLQRRLEQLDLTLRDVTLLIADEEDRVKVKLRGMPERIIEIATRPAEKDPAFRKLLEARSTVKFNVGTVWSEPHGTGERHLIVYWKEWPIIKALHDDRNHVLDERDQRVRDWIATEFSRHGRSLFQVGKR